MGAADSLPGPAEFIPSASTMRADPAGSMSRYEEKPRNHEKNKFVCARVRPVRVLIRDMYVTTYPHHRSQIPSNTVTYGSWAR
eukprot:2452649-Prymnesium_polylepis.2